MLDSELRSFIGYLPMPLRHGMTLGELALLFNAENRLRVELHVIPVRNWQRGDWWDSTGLYWTDPSPNMRSLTAALLYPGLAMLEASRNYSVGRGTDSPFEQIGAPWIDGRQLAAHLSTRYIPGVRFYPTRFRPSASHFADQWIEGVRFLITDREAFSSTRLGLELAAALASLYPGQMALEANSRLVGSQRTLEALAKGEDPRSIHQANQEAVAGFLKRREEFLLYR
jgi:uncharacterized protein YbbC (DUF1343 family)